MDEEFDEDLLDAVGYQKVIMPPSSEVSEQLGAAAEGGDLELLLDALDKGAKVDHRFDPVSVASPTESMDLMATTCSIQGQLCTFVRRKVIYHWLKHFLTEVLTLTLLMGLGTQHALV